jgi:large subunit ribosomal protein L21e
MVQRTGGYRKKTRSKLRKRARDKGKVTVNRILQKFKVGDRVRISIEPAIQKGMPHPRFANKVATVVEKRGSGYMIEFMDGGKKKRLLSLPVHLSAI